MPKRFFVSARKDRSAEADALSAELSKRGWERPGLHCSRIIKPDRDAEVAAAMVCGGDGKAEMQRCYRKRLRGAILVTR